MRGPSTNTATAEQIESVVPFDDGAENENLSNHMICSRSASNASSKKEEEDGTPIWKVGRILMDSLSKGKMRRTKIFGAPLEDLPLNCQGMPKIVHRLCCYLEQYGLKEPDLFAACKKQGKLVERYKISFDRAGDADLESCNDVKVIASLLKLWLHDLPHPLIPQRMTSRLTSVFQKYERKEVYDLNAELCNVLVTCPALNLGVLYTVVRLLYFYVTKWYPAPYVDQLPEMFAKILIGDSQIEHVEIITTLIHNFREIFNERVLERAFKLYLIRDKKNRSDERVDLTITGECGNMPLSVDKLTRSNSEEKLSIQSDQNQNLSNKNVNMRRVNSHEDFSGHLQHGYCRSVQVVIVDNQENDLSRNNLSDYQIGMYGGQQCDEPVVDNFKRISYPSDKDSEVLVAPPPFNYHEDSRVQEEIRNAERFTPQFSTHRNVGRRKRAIYQGHNVKPKMKALFEENSLYGASKQNDVFSVISHDYTNESSSSPSDSNTSQDSDTHSISSTSSSSSSESSSPTKIPNSPEPAQYFYDLSEPLTSYENWSFAHRHPHNSQNTDRSVPPKSPISLSRHSYDMSSSSHAVHLSSVEMKIVQVNKHLQWIKRKMRRFEEDFESKFGETPTISNKMAHPEYKHMSASIIYLKNNLKQLRKEANESFSAHRLHVMKNPNNSVNLGLFSSSPMDKEKALQEVEKQLCEKRIASERPECVEDMTHEQLQDEKVSIQKELLHLESTFGQTVARNEELFHPVYARYRTVKRFLARSTASLKLKETSSDLATIIENETMEFDSGNTLSICEDKVSSVCQPLCNTDGIDVRISNIHELSSPELMMEYKATKEEKKKLRNRIYMYEQEAENKTLNDSKHCIHSLRSRYKNTKAKLKLLEALLMKSK